MRLQRRQLATVAAILGSTCVVSCTVGPKYQRPVAANPPAFKALAGNDQWKMAAPSDSEIKGRWWEMFGDPALNALEEKINVDNQSVKQAEAQFRQSRAIVDLNHANYYPTISSSPSLSQGDTARLPMSSTFSLPVSASWEPDLWGRIRLSVQNAVANAQVSAADLENVRLSLQAQLAADYFALAGVDMQTAILRDTIGAYERYLQLTMNRYNGGVASKADVSLAQTQLASARAAATDLQVSRAQLEHAMAVLTGQPPSSLEVGVTMIAAPPPPIPLAIPSQLLERRPDIAANERLVMAANANIGIAEEAYYPRVILSANAGFLASSLQSLFTYASRTWSAGPGLTQTLFDFGRRNANVAISEAAYDSTVAGYRQTVLSAFQEVEDDLAALRYLAEEATQQQEAVVAAQESLDLELDRYKAGTESYLNVITTQSIALNDERAAVTLLQRRMTAAVDLVKAMGGGWDASTLPSGDLLRSVALADPKNTGTVAQPVNQ